MGRIARKIEISEADHKELKRWSLSQTMESRYVLRSKIILMSLDNCKLREISSRLGITEATANKWRNRFREDGIEGLDDLLRSGKPPVISAETKAEVIRLACSPAEDGYTNWSQQRIADKCGISKSLVQKILSEADIKPHKIKYWCGKTTDPEFTDKMTSIVGLYMNPPENALVICVDEKTQMQALDRTQPLLPLKPGKPKRLTTTYKRNGTVSLMAALSVHSGKIMAEPVDKNDSVTFLKFIKKIYRRYRHKEIHLIIDNHSIHKQVDVRAWLESKSDKIKVHFTPTYASWLNQIEIWFGILSKDVIKGGIWKSRQEMVDQIIEYIQTYNSTRAKPFSWNYDGKPLSK